MLTMEARGCWGPQKTLWLPRPGEGEAGRGGARLPGVSVVDELLDREAGGDGVREVHSIAVINNHDRPGSAALLRSRT